MLDLQHRIEVIGRGCAQRNSAAMIESHKGDVEGLLAEINKQWAESVSHDKHNGIATVKGREQETCPCPLASQSGLSSSYCLCSQGWFKQAFETAFGAAVRVEVVESVLGGAARCSFRVQRST